MSAVHRGGEFLWKLPENHAVQAVGRHVSMGARWFQEQRNALPAFATPYMAEIFLSRDDEESIGWLD